MEICSINYTVLFLRCVLYGQPRKSNLDTFFQSALKRKKKQKFIFNFISEIKLFVLVNVYLFILLTIQGICEKIENHFSFRLISKTF
jgi:hypothetical protein